MSKKQYQIVLVPNNGQRLTVGDLASNAGLHPMVVERFAELGLITPVRQGGDARFDLSAVARVKTIARLRKDLGINLAGVSVVLDLLDKLSVLRREMATLRLRG